MCDLSRSMRIGSRTTWYLSLEELGASPNPSRDFLDQLQELSTFESCWSLASLETSPVQEQVTWGHCDDVHGRHSALSSCSSAVETSSGEICQQCPVRLYPGLQGCYCDNRIYQSVQRSPSEHVREFVYPESGPYSGNFQVQSNDVDADQRYGTFISPDSWSDVVDSIEDCVSGSVYGSAIDCRSRLLERATGVVECSDQGPCCEFDSELDSTVGTNASPENQRECYYDDAQDVFCYLRIPETPANLYDVRSKVAEGRCNVNPDPDLGLSDNVGRYVEREGLCPVNLVHQNGAHQHPHPARSANFSAGRGGEDSGFASSGASSPAPGRPNSGCHGDAARRKRRGRRRHEEKYEICLGYPCYEFNLPDRHLLIYSLQKNKDLMEDLVGNSKLKNGFSPDTPKPPPGPQQHNRTASPSQRPTLSPDHPNPAAPITESPSTEMARVGWVLRTLILARAPNVIRDRKSSHHVFRRCAAGTELVDWLLSLSPAVHTRHQATAMWQALLEEGVISHVTMEQPFKDKFLFYRFWQDEEGASPLPSEDDASEAEDELNEVLAVLAQRGPDAMMRVILRKPSHERTLDDLETIYEELLHIKALSHLSNSVKRELAAVIVFEAHPRAGTVLFHQGDEGRSWYIILRGSVNVVIHGKGTVTSLQEGDDFGKLALINDAPRAATIVLREDNCHFLRVDKENFNRILRDVEANTVRLKEHGQDVLVLEKISSSHAVAYSQFKYTVMAGTPQKMLEHLLETRLDGRAAPGRDELPGPSTSTDPFLDDFLLTHIVFMPTHQLVTELGRHYRIDSPSQDREFLLACKRRVVQFVHRWVVAIRKPVFDEPSALSFMEDLANEVESDCAKWSSLREEAGLMHQVMSQLRRYVEEKEATSGQKWKLPPNGQPISLFGAKAKDHEEIGGRTTIRPLDDMIFRVYCADHTYCTLRFPVCTTAETIKHSAADKLGLKHDDLVLVEVKSSGERIVFKDGEVSIATGLSLNGRIFVSPREHLDALTPLPEQEAASGTDFRDVDLEMFSTKELAYHITEFDWNLFLCVHEYELIYHTFGRHHFRKITANLDVFLRRFNEIQFWIVTELCLTPNLSKRVQLLRKFIKLAAYCKEYQNLNAFFAIVMGLSNVAISRLSLTWEKLPSKFRKMYTEFESLIDPSRNHRSYRISVGKLQPPVIPFMPLLLKDMTFTHEGNKTSLDGLVNFEKMHMLAQTMRTIRYCRSRQLVLDPPTPKSEAEVRSYIRCLRIIDNQRVLTNLSQKLEPRRS